MSASTDYIEPAHRPATWAAMARDYAARGWLRHEIASALCVDEPTVDRLLAAGDASPDTAAAEDTSERASETEPTTPDVHSVWEDLGS
ncbi:hypothetical protein [Streptomyces sp. NBC_00989]|uniref:hypothetical protein n=1 Tax=Streptomyces sp. NBC_00989 TaxID=2903705 RepID=UPI002F9142B5|nr:hypothetical protein OG714_55110 [Streptomyces sp. NBC_00989]